MNVFCVKNTTNKSIISVDAQRHIQRTESSVFLWLCAGTNLLFLKNFLILSAGGGTPPSLFILV